MNMEEPGAPSGDLKRIVRHASTSRLLALRWTPRVALVSLIGAVIFAWTFVRVIIFFVFW
ncbi:hypothetical protein FAZ95_37120 [Trinickia violacea]|uniref:Uncharacterized protein n=1 Tax=Trinickia violacea TaxID=2571746 RepID=A0A4P8IYT5_9BURK|nr:hypothetical protein [Trinickia violacea]QCP54512.1 hypothetical protein FAZ95_37120 [Trinickia violacea]